MAAIRGGERFIHKSYDYNILI